MDSYTITIAPNDDSGAATRLVIDASGGQVRITDVHLHAPQGLSSGHIPTVDFDLLLQAVTGAMTASSGQHPAGVSELSAPQGALTLEAAARTEPADQSAAPAARKGRARKATPRTAATPSRRPALAPTATAASGGETLRRADRDEAPPRQRRTAKQAAVKATGKTVTTKTPPTSASKRAATRAATPAKSKTPAKRARVATTTATSSTSGRVYRRTPDDLAAVFEQVGTVAGIAAHYQVPRYTAQGWVSRLRATA
ncbi:hypothetical protein AB0368_37915 [Actinoplanes sp. NPDC051475]|uniref:hypothetical protein n=1 Tax=Actinoplanes sp. NPDC051475 TaxID=3157225 RepID=UPI003450BC1E